jgi:hypothetical protein
VVLMRPQTQELGTCFGARHGGGSVAAERRWCVRGECRRCHEERGAEVGKARATRGREIQQEVALGGLRRR